MCRLNIFVLDSHLATLWESNCPFGFLLVMFPLGSNYFVFVFLSRSFLWWEMWVNCIGSWSLPSFLFYSIPGVWLLPSRAVQGYVGIPGEVQLPCATAEACTGIPGIWQLPDRAVAGCIRWWGETFNFMKNKIISLNIGKCLELLENFQRDSRTSSN